jgi:hypothetical protein
MATGTENIMKDNIKYVSKLSASSGIILACLTIQSVAGIGMTMPVDPPAETCTLNIAGSAGTPGSSPDLLPLGDYNPPQNSQSINPLSSTDNLSTTCDKSWASCPSDGSVNEPDGRLNSFLRGYAASQDAKYILASAVWTQLGLTVPGNPNISTCGGFTSGAGSNANCATALAQVAVTGRHAFNSFAAWISPISSTSGPQLLTLDSVVQTGHTAASPQLLPSNFTATIPPISAAPVSIASTALLAAENAVLQQAYTALWAIRANDPTWRQFREGAGWIAVSGEDDTPQRPVNVATAPFQQFDIPVPVSVNGQSFTLTTRFSLMSQFTELSPPSLCSLGCLPQSPPSIPAPPIPTVATTPCLLPQGTCNLLDMPPQNPTLVTGDFTPVFLLYIHGGGSRLEEADSLATQLILRATGKNAPVVVSFDLPDSAYADTDLVPVGAPASTLPVPLDASSILFENGPNGSSPANIGSFPVLNFEINFINSFVATLKAKNIIDTSKLVAIMGGSLGGNTSLILQMRPLPSPFSLTSPLSIPAEAATIAWSPTSMVQDASLPFAASAITSGNMGDAPTWQGESPSTRSQYFTNLYFVPTGTPSGITAGLISTLQTLGALPKPPTVVTSFPSNLTGLPPDPEQWYRDDWVDANGVKDCKQSFVAQSRFDRYEVYSSLMRLWTTAIDTEQVLFSFQDNTDTTGKTWAPFYGLISGRLLLAAGSCDDYDNELSGTIYSTLLNGIVTSGIPMGAPIGHFSNKLVGPIPINSIGTCNGLPIGNTGANLLSKQDIYGFTHDVANDLQSATGRALFINDTGHSIHDERPEFFAENIISFLDHPDNNINVTLATGGDDARENSEVHVLLASNSSTPSNVLGQSVPVPTWSLDIPLNYWFHPWPSGPLNWPMLQPLGDPDNPCGTDCTKINSFDLRNGTTHNFTIALPAGAAASSINTFQLEFFSGWNITPPGNIGYGNDNWDLSSITACVPGAAGAFISNSFSGSGQSIQAQNYGAPGVMFTPPSFSPALGTSQVISSSNCQSSLSNPPPNSQAPGL